MNNNKENMSLIFKWLPSENCSSKEKKILAKRIRNSLGFTPKQYRKMLSIGREALNIVERDMTSRNWKGINYQAVASRAQHIYSKAFRRHDEERYQTFLDKVKTGEAKINAGTLYPYDLVSKARLRNDATVDAQWNSLPDYCEGSDAKALVVVDTSGSMTWTPVSPQSKVYPIDVALSLGVYFAERINGPFKNHFITFSQNPKLHKVTGSTLRDKMQSILGAIISGNTNLQATFDMLLEHAKKNKVSQSDMPNSIIIVSDLQFDSACSNNKKTNFELIKQKYQQAGYEAPQLIFWNVQSRVTQSPVKKTETGVTLVSGCSPSVFQFVCNGVMKTPYEIMLDTLNSEIFDCLTV